MKSIEHAEQVLLMQWWALSHQRFGIPEQLLFAIPNGGERNIIVAALERKLLRAVNADDRLWACRSCYGIDIQYDNVQTTRERCAQLAALFGVPYFDALFVFPRNIIHGDFLFFPQIARIYDWTANAWTTLADMMLEGSDNDAGKKGRPGV